MAPPARVRLIARHPVADYDAWRRAFDALAPARRSLGIIGEAVYQALDDAGDVTVCTDFATAHAARAFDESPTLRAAMQRAGVAATPETWLVRER
jgi:hypothetical protein